MNKVNYPFPPAIRGYSWFLEKNHRPFIRTAIYVHSKWAKLVAKVPDTEAEMDMEMIHLQISTLPTLHILGVYLDSNPTVDHVAKVQARLVDKLQKIKALDKECPLNGDLNCPMDNLTEPVLRRG